MQIGIMRMLLDEAAMLVRMVVRFAVRIGRRIRMPMMRLPVAWERINEIWYDYVKGLNPAAYFGIFDVVRLDTVWLDKA